MLTDEMEAQLRASALSYVRTHPEDIAPRIKALKANIARLDVKEAGRGLPEKAMAIREENRRELQLLEGFAATLGIQVEG